MGSWICRVLVTGVLVCSTANKLSGQGKRDLVKIRNASAAKLVEPKYVNEPRYALVVIGVDAEKQMWIVLDGFNTLYADLDGDGKLNGKSEKLGQLRTVRLPPIVKRSLKRPTIRQCSTTAFSPMVN